VSVNPLMDGPGAPEMLQLKNITMMNRVTWSRCYDHNFRRFLPIYGEKIGVFLKNQCYD
jgi:hypothetical protein